MHSKTLAGSDISGDSFAAEMLNGDATYGINFDRIQWHNARGKYVIVELAT